MSRNILSKFRAAISRAPIDQRFDLAVAFSTFAFLISSSSQQSRIIDRQSRSRVPLDGHRRRMQANRAREYCAGTSRRHLYIAVGSEIVCIHEPRREIACHMRNNGACRATLQCRKLTDLSQKSFLIAAISPLCSDTLRDMPKILVIKRIQFNPLKLILNKFIHLNEIKLKIVSSLRLKSSFNFCIGRLHHLER